MGPKFSENSKGITTGNGPKTCPTENWPKFEEKVNFWGRHFCQPLLGFQRALKIFLMPQTLLDFKVPYLAKYPPVLGQNCNKYAFLAILDLTRKSVF